jgi:glycerophosphoryl diester phosphodiesterase
MNSKWLRWSLASSLAVLGAPACESLPEVSIPQFTDGGLVRDGTALSREQLYVFEGMFAAEQGSKVFGDELAVRTSRGTVSLLTDKYSGYGVLSAACLRDGRVVVEGYWQYPTRTDAGLVRLFVEPPELAAELCAGEVLEPAGDLVLAGYYGEGDEFPNLPVRFSFSRELQPWRGRFYNVAHHGACENTDYCGVSPNSMETVRLAERIGSNAAELDVRLTRDGIPILFHDPGLSSSLVQGLFCNGRVAELTLAELRGNCRLRYGEVLPTLEELIDMVIDETELEGLYLDMKVADAVLPSARLAAAALARLNERNTNDDPTDDRRVGLLVAIPTEEVLDAWRTTKATLEAEGIEVPPCLLEYDPDLVISEGCVAWGPTWTEGPQAENVQRVRAAGSGTIFWTINQSDFIDEFLVRAQPDGVITARAAQLFVRYQQIGTPPPERSMP